MSGFKKILETNSANAETSYNDEAVICPCLSIDKVMFKTLAKSSFVND